MGCSYQESFHCQRDGHCQCVVEWSNVSGSSWTDLGSGSHGSLVWNGRSGVVPFWNGSDPSERLAIPFHSWLSSHDLAPSASLIMRHLVMRGTCTLFWAAHVTIDKSPGPLTSHYVVVVVDRAIDLWMYLMLCSSVVLSSENRSVCVKSIVKPSMELFLWSWQKVGQQYLDSHM